MPPQASSICGGKFLFICYIISCHLPLRRHNVTPMSSQSTTDSTRTGCTPGGKELLVSSTIDFLDCAFFCHDGPEDYYPQEEYEKLIRNMSEGGIRKIYFRANVCGLTHYPTAVSRQYGCDDAYHYAFRKQAQWLKETYRRYNPCLETIRLGHKYGMEVWCWENLRT